MIRATRAKVMRSALAECLLGETAGGRILDHTAKLQFAVLVPFVVSDDAHGIRSTGRRRSTEFRREVAALLAALLSRTCWNNTTFSGVKPVADQVERHRLRRVESIDLDRSRPTK